ncbi:MAG: hypothetical protein LBJ08_06875, partial [Bifidobacteriaceae bacterium]|nr:hypothetical protein [Bifidobacteriaceae bacterium]
ERTAVLSDVPAALAFLFVEDRDLEFDPESLAGLNDDAPRILRAVLAVFEAEPDLLAGGAYDLEADAVALRAANLQTILRAALVDGMGLRPRLAFTALRVAVTGRRVSPPLFESMAILGRDTCLARIAALAGRLGGS